MREVTFDLNSISKKLFLQKVKYFRLSKSLGPKLCPRSTWPHFGVQTVSHVNVRITAKTVVFSFSNPSLMTQLVPRQPMSNYVDVRINLEVWKLQSVYSIWSWESSLFGYRGLITLETTFSQGTIVRKGGSPFQIPWGQHLARERSLDGGPSTLGRTPSRSVATPIETCSEILWKFLETT